MATIPNGILGHIQGRVGTVLGLDPVASEQLREKIIG